MEKKGLFSAKNKEIPSLSSLSPPSCDSSYENISTKHSTRKKKLLCPFHRVSPIMVLLHTQPLSVEQIIVREREKLSLKFLPWMFYLDSVTEKTDPHSKKGKASN
ncbi:hypothetical protein SAY87_029865 [Trapa incisa]|uniref:Uncharacterized protein n=1 Tax=Trapa incisa TaxID=236973 RepID=A0AAN7K8A8_9MYRT|nr:hypothetical protein SAY87_029865 [Trapa incisa]